MNCAYKSSFMKCAFRSSYIFIFINISSRIWTKRINVNFIHYFIFHETPTPPYKEEETYKRDLRLAFLWALLPFYGRTIEFFHEYQFICGGQDDTKIFTAILFSCTFRGFFRNWRGFFLQPLSLLSVHAPFFFHGQKKQFLVDERILM